MLVPAEEAVDRWLSLVNPWWETGKLDEHYRRFGSPRLYLNAFLRLVRTDVRRSVVLMGPRRVGKTVMIHHTIARLLTDGVDPKHILYASVDAPVLTGLTLEELLSRFAAAHGHKFDKQTYAFFDEVQYHRDWERHLKALHDSYPRIRFVASGSAAAALRLKSRESGAGRFTDFLLPPYTFVEFFVTAHAGDLGLADLDQNRLEAALVEYVNFGGFPEAVHSEEVRQRFDRFVAEDIVDKVLLRDLPSLYGIDDPQDLKRFFVTLAYNTGQEVNLETLSGQSGTAKNTVRKYLEYLEAAFLIHRLPRVDQNARRFKRATHFKVYLTNPSMRAALFGPVMADDPTMGALAENALVSQFTQSDTIELIRYARWGKGEVDIVVIDPLRQKPFMAIEVKWSERFSADHPMVTPAFIQFVRDNKPEIRTIATRNFSGSREIEGVGEIQFVPTAIECFIVFTSFVVPFLNAGQRPRRIVPDDDVEPALDRARAVAVATKAMLDRLERAVSGAVADTKRRQ